MSNKQDKFGQDLSGWILFFEIGYVYSKRAKELNTDGVDGNYRKLDSVH